jgi:hypothetical protein
MAKQNKFLNRVWSKKAKMPSFYSEKISWDQSGKVDQ